MRLEELQPGMQVLGLAPLGAATVVQVQWHGSGAATVAYRDGRGQLLEETLFRDREPSLELLATGTGPRLDGDSALFRLVNEARRIEVGSLFDPFLAVSTSAVQPLPH